MADYSLGDLVKAASSAGFQGTSLVTAVAVSLAEDGRMELKAVNTNSDGSRDRGPWQINSKWHPEVSDTCAFDLNCSAQAAFKISNQGQSWTPWATFNNGAYKSHLSDATAATSNPSSPSSGPSVPGLPDLSGIGTAISSAVSTFVSAAQIAAGALIIGFGIAVAIVMVALKNA